MCRPIEGNLVRSKKIVRPIKPLQGSSEALMKRKQIILPERSQGIAEGQARGLRDYFIIIFELGALTLRARMHHTEIKGVEQHA